MTLLRVAALGDSLTEGLGDPDPGGGWRGWAALLAAGLTPLAEAVDLHNLAVSGARAADVARTQLPTALEHRPHLASVLVGANDTLRASYDIHSVTADLDAVMAELSAGGTVLLTACLPDPGRLLRLPGPLARPLARRMHCVNEVVHALSERYAAVHVHAAEADWIDDPRMWSVDRLHPSERGHRALAREFHAVLAADGTAAGPAPTPEPESAAPSRAAQTWWMATKGTRWIAERCTDLLPDLLRLAAAEARQRDPRALDQAAAHRTAAALAAVSVPNPAIASRGGLRAVS
ncbi:SGNH/GDSL hydrolase family protein [Streptacidiphilus carbonis]|uniref:SGNH/GDSL hydrolase family protein n=1 Tax=Streptacidiphilus carbonis TaxID=105422 RepID=UPI000A477B31|nr:SGNH/GDSL hydrolase family protein [Streptacidiphilus carbonis]